MENRFSAGKKAAVLGIAVNVALLAFKFVTGYGFSSRAMIADGFNSLGDVFASVVTLLGSAYAARPRDAGHAWGHGKAEYIASMSIGFSMTAMAVYTVGGSAAALTGRGAMTFSPWLAAAAGVTIGAKSVLYVYCARKGKKYDSVLIRANAADHRNDVLVTSGTLCAVLLGLTGLWWADGVVGIAISCWIAYNGIRIVAESSRVLMDENAARDKLTEYRDEILAVRGVDHLDSVVAKPVGAKYILIVKISVSRDMKVLDSHEIAKKIETNILKSRPEVDDVIVHVNPDLPHGDG